MREKAGGLQWERQIYKTVSLLFAGSTVGLKPLCENMCFKGMNIA